MKQNIIRKIFAMLVICVMLVSVAAAEELNETDLILAEEAAVEDAVFEEASVEDAAFEEASVEDTSVEEASAREASAADDASAAGSEDDLLLDELPQAASDNTHAAVRIIASNFFIIIVFLHSLRY